MIIAFCVWFLVSAIAPKLNAIGFHLTKSQLYWLTAMPGLSGGFIRLVYMFLPPVIGTRRLVGYSSLLYLIPMLGWFFAVQNTSTGYGTLLLLAFLCGVGGGSFSGYMPSTGYFFPKSKQGTALGVQAGIGNLGMSIVQLLGPWLMGFGLLGLTWIAPQHTAGSPLWVHNIAIVFVPWTILATILAFTMLKDVPVKANFRRQIDIFTNPDTWIMTLMYVMTFGLFSGFSAQFGLLIENTYGNSSNLAHGFSNLPAGASYAFLGPLIGSLVRVVWGPLCDRFGGAIWTLVSGIGMALTFGFCVFRWSHRVHRRHRLFRPIRRRCRPVIDVSRCLVLDLHRLLHCVLDHLLDPLCPPRCSMPWLTSDPSFDTLHLVRFLQRRPDDGVRRNI